MSDKPEASAAFPERLVRLQRGGTVVVRPWTLAQGMLMRKRVVGLVLKVQRAGLEAAKDGATGQADLGFLLEHAETEVIEIIKGTCAVDDDYLQEHFDYEDLATVGKAIWETCLVRPDGGGVLGKLLGVWKGATGAPAVSPEMAERLEEAREAGRQAPPTPESSERP